jgi:pyruvate carboxylase
LYERCSLYEGTQSLTVHKFIGPTPEVINSLGDKVSARNLAIKNNVPVVPGTDGPVSEFQAAEEFVQKYGYPVIIKAAFGGGGRGMRVVREGESIREAFDRATSE